MKLTATQRKFAYAGLVAVNAALVALSTQGLLPASVAHGAQFVSLLLSAFMREVGASEPSGGAQ